MWELGSLWPEFMLHDPIADVYYSEVGGRWASFALLAVDGDAVVGRGFCVPFSFGEDVGRPRLPDAGWDTVIMWAHLDVLESRVPNSLCALEVTIAPSHRAVGLAGRLLDAMRDVARRRGLDRLVAPVRPTRKHQYPEMSMTDYIARRRPDGLPEDSWLRLHERIGGTIGTVCPVSMVIAGTPAQWRDWTGLPFDADGPVTVPGAVAPVTVDLEADVAVYVEPNVWVEHDVPATGSD